MPQGPRTARVGEEFREILAEEIQRLKDPRIGFVTVTGVKVSPDLRVAWIYFTAFGDEKQRAASRAALRSASAHLRHELGRQIRLKSTPELRFEEDATPTTGERIDRILDDLHRGEENERPAMDDAAGAVRAEEGMHGR
jgi:ribosome-binding factor A